MVLPHDDVGAGPALVLLHAGIADRTMWSEHVPRFADAGYRVVAVDLQGFGEAVVEPGIEAPWLDITDTLDALSIDSAALVGNSFGGAVALRVAVVAPRRVTALVLVSAPPPALEPSAELQAIWKAEEAALERGDVDAAVRQTVDAWTLADGPQQLRDRVATMQRRAFALQAEATETTEAPDPLEEDADALLSRLALPTLVAVGAHDKPDFLDGAESMANAIPGARHAIIPGAGHLAPLETPDAFADLVLGFLPKSA
jgi:pimeloyl-ACP methyl ester carboxylesterase